MILYWPDAIFAAGSWARTLAPLATQADTDRPAWRLAITSHGLLEAGLIVAGYLLCFWVGQKFLLPTGVSVVWPPSGFILAVLLRLGMRAIVPLWIGAAVANLVWSLAPPVVGVLLPGLSIAEALVGMLLLRLVCFDSSLRRLRDIASLVAVGAPISTLLNALAAVYILSAFDVTSWADYWENVP